MTNERSDIRHRVFGIQYKAKRKDNDVRALDGILRVGGCWMRAGGKIYGSQSRAGRWYGDGSGGGDSVEGKGEGADEKRERAIRTCKRGKARSLITV